MWLCLAAVACSSPPKVELKPSSKLVTSLMQRLQTPRTTMHALRDDLDVLFTRSDATAAIVSRYQTADVRERWYIGQLAIVAAQRGSRRAVDFLLGEALVPDPTPSDSAENASAGPPLEGLNKAQAAMGLVSALVNGTGGSVEALRQLLNEGDAWLAKMVSMGMAHDRVMSESYEQILSNRGLVSRFREMTQQEALQHRTLNTAARTSADAPPAF
jgi:hypothetical protein